MNFKLSIKLLISLLLIVLLGYSIPVAAINTNSNKNLIISPVIMERFTELPVNDVIVELKSDPLSTYAHYRASKDGLDRIALAKNNLIKEHKYFSSFVNKNLSRTKIKYEYFNVFNGYAIETTTFDLNKLKENREVEKIYGVNEYYLHREFSVPAVHAPEVWELKDKDGNPVTGKGTLVGVIDTGIDYWHGDLGCGIGPNYKVKGGYDFSEMNDIPYDSSISFHGTHVSGIIAGIGEAGIASGNPVPKGVAPDASLMAYKVFSNARKTTGGDAILAALDRSVADKCDVINLSLGKYYGWTEDPLSLACDNAAKAGVIVVASAGNDGERDADYNRFPISSPSSGEDVISVAACDESEKSGFDVLLDGEKISIFGNMMVYSPPLPEGEEFELVAIPGIGKISDYEGLDVTGKAVLIRRGDLSFKEKNINAKNAGAAVAIVYNNVSGLFGGTLGESDSYIPMLAISKEDGEKLLKITEETTSPKIQIKFEKYHNLGLMASFSAEGPTPDLNLKPDLTAPGYNVLSSAPGDSYSYASGTSMSAPHVSGGAALMKQLHPDWTPREIKSILTNYSEKLIDPSTNKPYSIYMQGAGRMNLLNSSRGYIVSDPVSISFKDIQKESKKEATFTLKNKGDKPSNINISLDSLNVDGVSVSIEPNSFSLSPNEEKLINVTLNIESENKLKKGYNEFSLRINYDDNDKMHLEAMFYYGEFKEMDYVLLSFTYPTVAVSPNNDNSGDYNYFYFLSPNIIDGVEVDLFDAEGKNHIGVLTYGRERYGSGFFSVPFDGYVNGNDLPDGTYTFKPYLLPIGKDYKEPSNWVSGRGSKVIIDRVAPKLEIKIEKNPNENTIHAYGKITENNLSLGVFLYYEIDNENLILENVKDDGSFSFNIPFTEDNFWIKFTAQDLAGNTASIKKKIPLDLPT